MQNKDIEIIGKIIEYIDDIAEYINNMSSHDFLQYKKTITACAFSVTQIGELVKNISDEVQNKYNNIPRKAIRGMRNIDLIVLWSTIKKNLPSLKSELEKSLFG